MKSILPLSRSNLSSLRKLLQKKYRHKSKTFLVEGLHSVEEALASDWKVEVVLVTKPFTEAHEQLIGQIEQRNITLRSITSRDVEAISDTEHAQGVVAVVHQKKYNALFLENVGAGMLVALDEVTEPGNLGAVIRTCDWFGVNAVMVSANSVELFNPKVVRATSGSIFHVPIITDVNMQSVLASLRSKGFRIYVTVIEDGVDVRNIQWSEKGVFVFGNEARGVSSQIKNLADALVCIPRFGRAESLNVGVACGVVLGSWRLFAKK